MGCGNSGTSTNIKHSPSIGISRDPNIKHASLFNNLDQHELAFVLVLQEDVSSSGFIFFYFLYFEPHGVNGIFAMKNAVLAIFD